MYRIVSGLFEDGNKWFIPQKKGWFLWHPVITGRYNKTYTSSIEDAKKIISVDKERCKSNNKIVWEE